MKVLIGVLMLLTLVLSVSVVSAMIGGWIFMVLAGALHHSVWLAVPAFSFWQSVLIVFAISFLFSLFNSSVTVRS